jgi:uncharacterized RDD family membrane protein YckC
MAALGITVLKQDVPWGPFTREQIEAGLSRGDFTVKYLAYAPGLKEWLPLGEVLDYVDRSAGPSAPSLPPVPGPRELPPIPEAVKAESAPAPPARPPVLPVIKNVVEQLVPPPAPPPPAKREVKPAPKPELLLKPASFFPRGVAFVIDCAILFVPVAALYLLGVLAIVVPALWEHANAEARTQDWALLNRNTRQLAWLVAVGFGWLYGAGLESSRAQATVGKRWVGIKVTDAHGERMSFLRSTGRYAAKYLSALPCFIGFIAALFSASGLALHDRLAGTRVVRN